MVELFTKRHIRVDSKAYSIFIDNQKPNIGKAVELKTVFKLTVPIPEIKVFENQNSGCHISYRYIANEQRFDRPIPAQLNQSFIN